MSELTLGIDIGGTYCKYGLCDDQGKIVYQSKIKTSSDILESCLKIKEETTSYDYKKVGIGIPNYNLELGCLDNAVNISAKSSGLKKDLESLFSDQDVLIENDANASAVGELVFGDFSKTDSFVYITLGTGVGMAYFNKGQMVSFCEGGHIPVVPNGRICPCGKKGHIESYLGVKGLEQTYFEVAGVKKDVDYILSEADNFSKEVIDISSDHLAFALDAVTSFCRPDYFIFSGGLSEGNPRLYQLAETKLNERIFKSFQGHSKVRKAHLKADDAGVVGASALFKIKDQLK